MNNFNSPILFIIFNRPETTKKVFETIQQIKPRQLFVAADGPRNDKPGEKELCEETRKIIEKVDWPCDVKTLFKEENLGCGKSPSQAISWFFENVEEGIILEDDCLPNMSFFSFCENMLNFHRFDDNIFMISGDNFLPKSLRPKESYYLSRMTHIWGWATWRRAWLKYSFEMEDFSDFIASNAIDDIWTDKKVQKNWLTKFFEVKEDHFSIWDYQWTYCMWKNDGYSISPNVNLVSNIGFGSKATHTFDKKDPFASLPTEEIRLPITLEKPSAYAVGDDYENKKLMPKKNYMKKLLKKVGILEIAKKIYKKILHENDR